MVLSSGLRDTNIFRDSVSLDPQRIPIFLDHNWFYLLIELGPRDISKYSVKLCCIHIFFLPIAFQWSMHDCISRNCHFFFGSRRCLRQFVKSFHRFLYYLHYASAIKMRFISKETQGLILDFMILFILMQLLLETGICGKRCTRIIFIQRVTM